MMIQITIKMREGGKESERENKQLNLRTYESERKILGQDFLWFSQ